MNLFGVGFLELAVIFLIAFLVMGPGKTIEMARTAGKLIGDVRRTMNEMTTSVDLNKDLSDSGRTTATSTTASTTDTAPKPPEPPPTGAVPTSGTGDGDEQQPKP